MPPSGPRPVDAGVRRRDDRCTPYTLIQLGSLLKDHYDLYPSTENQDPDSLDSDSQNMTLMVLMSLSSNLTILESSIALYKKFDMILGGYGPSHHQGFVKSILKTINHCRQHATKLSTLRDQQQRGTPDPGAMEGTANRIYNFVNVRFWRLESVVNEGVNMESKAGMDDWIMRKDEVLQEFLGRMTKELEELRETGAHVIEIEAMTAVYTMRWKTYAALTPEELRTAGLV